MQVKAEALIARGNAALAAERLDDARRCYREATDIAPTLAAAHLNLGYVLAQQGHFEASLIPLQQAARLDAGACDAHYLLGGTHVGLGNMAAAIASFERAIAADPEFVLAYRDLGKALSDTGQNARAEAILRQALAREPGSFDLHLFLGNVLAADGQLDAAIVSYEAALRLRPDDAATLANLALALSNRGDDAQAIEFARRAIASDPSMLHARSNLLLALSRHPPCPPAEYLAEARAYGEALARYAVVREPWPSVPPREPGQCLRIGFVSADLRSHPVGYFLDGVLAHWDGEAMVAIVYSNHRSRDALTARLRSSVAEWHDISGMTDVEAEQLIQANHVDLLIDLSGHTPDNRLALFARRPAPVQATWLGYWASTGVAAIDYLLCDKVSIVDGASLHYSERLWHLPDTRLCFSPPMGAELRVAAAPALASGVITFGSFQGLPKLTDAVLHVWARVLREVPGSRLRLQAVQFKCGAVRERLRERLHALGVPVSRVQLIEPGSRMAYLAAHAEVDILLDSFPHPGGTTTCEALWMGVPTVTLAGQTMLSRQGASLLSCAGLPDWIAFNEDDYVRIACRHASDLPRLGKLRLRLRDQVAASSLFDGQRFARALQSALRGMWREKAGFMDGRGL